MKAALRRVCARTWTVIAALALVAALPRAARAQASNAATAQALYDQAKTLMAEGDYAKACPKLEESQKLDPASGTLLNLADCYEHEGRTASAWSTFLEAAAAARNSGNAAREQVSRERARALVPKLSKLAIEVPESSRVDGLAITRDGLDIGPPLWGTATPVDPGKHHVSATAPGHERWDGDIEVPPGGEVRKITVPALTEAPEAPAAPEAQPAAAAAAPPPPPPSEPPPSTGLGTQKILALVAGGIGVVGAGIGAGFGLRSKAKHDAGDKHCDGSVCRDQTGVSLRSDAISAGNISTAGFVVGAVGLAAGTVLWVTAKGEREREHVAVGIGPGRISVKGAW